MRPEPSAASENQVVLQGSSLWQGLPDEHCRWQPCMWSERERSNIDLWLSVFSRMDSMALECPEPRGGQTAGRDGKQPEIAFIVTMHNQGRMAAQCLLELFRCNPPPGWMSSCTSAMSKRSLRYMAALLTEALRLCNLLGMRVSSPSGKVILCSIRASRQCI